MRGPHPPEKWKRIGKAYQYILAPLLLYLNIFLKDLPILIFLKRHVSILQDFKKPKWTVSIRFSLSLSLSLSPRHCISICFKTKLFLSPRHSISIFFKTLCFYYFVLSHKINILISFNIRFVFLLFNTYCRNWIWIGPNIVLDFSPTSLNNEFVECGWKN